MSLKSLAAQCSAGTTSQPLAPCRPLNLSVHQCCCIQGAKKVRRLVSVTREAMGDLSSAWEVIKLHVCQCPCHLQAKANVSS